MVYSKRFVALGMCLLLTLLSFSVFDLTPVSAGVITVTTTVDEDGGDNEECSLREAIKAANTDSDYGGCTAGSGEDLIVLPEGVYTLTIGSQLPFVTTDITIQGQGLSTTIIQANACNPVTQTCTHKILVFWVADTGDLSLENLTVRHGRVESSSFGGGIFNQGDVHLSNAAVNYNLGIQGGAIRNAGTGNITIENSMLYENKADNGGAVFNSGDLTVLGSTFQGNMANNGAAIRNDGELEITNSTFSGNQAEARAGGVDNHGVATITNATFWGNEGTQGVGVYNGEDDILNFSNTIITQSQSGGDCENAGDISTNSKNLVEDGSCDADYDGDPLLGPLTDNGGPTKTHQLLSGSPAVDNGDAESCPLFDQRGIDRPKGAGCDIGAFEFFPAVAAFTASPLTGRIPLKVAFTNGSSGEYDACYWDFGDNSNSSLCNPHHTFTEPGTYTVTLTVSGLGGSDTLIRTDYILVEGFKNFLPILAK